MSKQKIFLNTSEIAAYINQNKYNFVTPFERLWKKVDQLGYIKTLNELNHNALHRQITFNKLMNEKELANFDLINRNITQRQYDKLISEIEEKEKIVKSEILNLNDKIDKIRLSDSELIEKSLGSDALKKINDSSIDTDDKKNITSKLINDLNVSDEVKNELSRQTDSLINKTHGTTKEDSAIEMFEKKFKVKLDVSQTYNKMFLDRISQNSKYDWYIGGKVDGLYIDSNNTHNSYVVEVKSRVKGFFNSVRDYENTQIQLYLQMLNLNNAKLVEKYNDKIRVTDIQKDQQYIDDIFTYLEIFTKNFEKYFLEDYNAKLTYVSCSDEKKKTFIKDLYLDEISEKESKLYELRMLKEEYADCLDDDLD